VQFQLHTEADFVSLPENVLSTGRAFTEVRESLIAGHVPAVQVNHRLVDRCRRSRQQQAGQALVAALAAAPEARSACPSSPISATRCSDKPSDRAVAPSAQCTRPSMTSCAEAPFSR